VVDLVEEALRLQEFLKSRQWKFCFIGGLAVQYWGEPRLTRDLDISLLTGFGGEATYVDELLAAYAPRIGGVREFALARRVLLLRSPGGIGIDVSLSALPYEEGVVDRAVDVELLPGSPIRLCSPGDLIVMKVFAGREIDLRDARSVAVRQRSRSLDWSRIEASVADLAELKGDPEMLATLRKIRDAGES